jgi:hypothetical protein
VDEVRVSMGDARVTHYHATTRVRVHGHGDPPPGQVELDVAGPGVVASLTYVADEVPIPMLQPLEDVEAIVTVVLRPRQVPVIESTGRPALDA